MVVILSKEEVGAKASGSQTLLRGLVLSNERLERELRDELSRSAGTTRSELGLALSTFQQALMAQAGDAMRTQSEQLRALAESNDKRMNEVRQTVEQLLQECKELDRYLAEALLLVDQRREMRVGDPSTVPVAVTLDVDLDHDADFVDTGESGYATGTLKDGAASITLPALPATGSYAVRARVTDLAGNQATSATQTVQVTSQASWQIASAQVLTSDPLTGDAREQLGDVQVSVPLDLDREWEVRLPATDRRLVTALTAPLLIRYGYGLGRPGEVLASISRRSYPAG